MTAIQDMYKILEDMVECAEKGQPEKVAELNKSFDALVPKVYRDPRTELELMYENCRQSCVLDLKDAKERFSKIPKPD